MRQTGRSRQDVRRQEGGARPASAAWTFRLVSGFLLVGLLGAGCGEQDLYKPPKSPYGQLAQLQVPSGCEGVSVSGSCAYVAAGEAGLLAVDISNPEAPVLVSVTNTPKYANAVAAVSVPAPTGIATLAFVAEGTEGVSSFNVARPDSVIYLQKANTFDTAGIFMELAASSTESYTFYVADNWRGLWVFTMDPLRPGDMSLFNRSYTRGYAKGVVAVGGFAYVADDEMGLAVLDARIPVATRIVSYLDTPGNAKAVDVQEGRAYVADGTDGLVIMSVHEGDTPVQLGHLALPGDCRAVAVRDDFAFVAADDGGLHIVDVSDPAAPRLAGSVAMPAATGVAVTASGIVVVSDKTGWLYVLGGPGGFSDRMAPAAVGDLAAVPRSQSSILLQWHAPGNDLYSGTASRYDIRYHVRPITESNWDSATVCQGMPDPAQAGTPEQFEVTGLSPSSEYSFALTSADGVPNWSPLSNEAAAVTFAGNVPPTLTLASFTPQGASPGSSVTFEVTYTDADGDAPSRAQLVLGGESIELEPQGDDFRAGVVYRHEAELGRGTFEHYFVFNDGHEHEVSTAPTPGPWIGDIFIMGSPVGEPGRDDADEDEHLIAFQNEVEISPYEVIQGEYFDLMGERPSSFTGDDSLPVENVTWFDAVRFCNAKSAAEGEDPVYTIVGDSVFWDQTKHGYRLPTEAEWERACRAGNRTAFANGPITVETCVHPSTHAVDPVLAQIGWYCGNAGTSTHPVGDLDPNADGLYDMHGNVWEWCWDWYSRSGLIGNPDGPSSGMQRVVRGGSWYYFARDCRSAARKPYWPNSKDNTVGFRWARTLP